MEAAVLDGAPPAETRPAESGSDLTLPPNAATSIAPELLATIPAPAEPEDHDAQPAPDLTTPEDSEESGEEETQQEPADPEAQVAEWVGLLEENPASITRIPRSKQGEAIRAMQERWTGITTAAMQQAYQAGIQYAQQSNTVMSQVASLDALLEAGDTEAFREEISRFPGGERAYYRAKAETTPVPETAPERYQERANAIFAELSARPDVQEKLRGSWNYSADDAGITRLEADVRRYLMEQGRPAPDNSLAQRQEAATRRAAAPKAEASPGSSAGGAMTLAAYNKLPYDQQVAWAAKASPEDLERLMSNRK